LYSLFLLNLDDRPDSFFKYYPNFKLLRDIFELLDLTC